MVSTSKEQRSDEVVKLVPPIPSLDGLPIEIFKNILTLAIDRPKRSLAYVPTTPGTLVLPQLESLTVYLCYEDEGEFSDREYVLEIEYVYKAVQGMLDGVKTYVEDIILGFKLDKNILQIQYSYKGKVEFRGFVFDRRLKSTKCEYCTKALWRASVCELIIGPVGE